MIEIPNIKEERRTRNWTQQTLSDLSDVPLPTLVRMEKKPERALVENLKKITDTFDKHSLNHFVYLLEAETIVKIGHTKDLKARRVSIIAADCHCEYQHFIKCGYWRAQRLEKMFTILMQRLWLRGEWFTCPPKAATFVLNICYEALNKVCPKIEMDYHTNHYIYDALKYIKETYSLSDDNLTIEKIVNALKGNHKKKGKPKSKAWKHAKQIQAYIDDNWDKGELAAKYGTSEATIRRIGKEEL